MDRLLNTKVPEMNNYKSSSGILIGENLKIDYRWCPGPESNRHGCLVRGILNPLCLPISPPGQVERETRIELATVTLARLCSTN